MQKPHPHDILLALLLALLLSACGTGGQDAWQPSDPPPGLNATGVLEGTRASCIERYGSRARIVFLDGSWRFEIVQTGTDLTGTLDLSLPASGRPGEPGGTATYDFQAVMHEWTHPPGSDKGHYPIKGVLFTRITTTNPDLYPETLHGGNYGSLSEGSGGRSYLSIWGENAGSQCYSYFSDEAVLALSLTGDPQEAWWP